jgi:hypothetical protein
MPRALVREQQRTMLTRAQTAMIGLIAVTCTSSVQPVYPAPTSKRLQTWYDHYSRDDCLEVILDYALVHQGLERECTKKYKASIEKKIVRANDFDPGLFQVKFRFQQAEFWRVHAALGVPAVFRTKKRYKFTGEVALLLYLAR